MFKHMDYKGTYCSADVGNVRYPSSAQGAEDGWAYIFTKDEGYVYDLSQYHVVQVRVDGQWTAYTGFCLTPMNSQSNPTHRSMIQATTLIVTTDSFCAANGSGLLMQVVTGTTRRDTRARLMRAFNTPFFPDILICSEVLGEGGDHRQPQQ